MVRCVAHAARKAATRVCCPFFYEIKCLVGEAHGASFAPSRVRVCVCGEKNVSRDDVSFAVRGACGGRVVQLIRLNFPWFEHGRGRCELCVTEDTLFC